VLALRDAVAQVVPLAHHVLHLSVDRLKTKMHEARAPRLALRLAVDSALEELDHLPAVRSADFLDPYPPAGLKNQSSAEEFSRVHYGVIV
jgi:hypothetical protein